MPNLSTETIDRLRAVEKAILAEPELYSQHSIYPLKRDCNSESVGMTCDSCGSPACLFGWAVSLFPEDAAFDNSDPANLGVEMGNAGRRALKMDSAIAGRYGRPTWELLFEPGFWPRDRIQAYYDAVTPAERAQVAVDRIEHFIKTDGAE